MNCQMLVNLYEIHHHLRSLILKFPRNYFFHLNYHDNLKLFSKILKFLYSLKHEILFCFFFEMSLKWDIMNRAHCILVFHACHFPMCWSGHIYNGLYMNLDCRFLKFQLFSLLLCSSWLLWPLGTWTTIGHYWLQAL
jgi:hypothetical protein